MSLHLFQSLVLSQIWMFLAWLGFRRLKNAMMADVVWGLGIMVLAWFHVLKLNQLNTSQGICLAFVTVWALRLSIYLYWTRLHPKKQDPRYQALEAKGQSMFINYQIQGLLQNIIALPWLCIPTQLTPVANLGLGIALLGFNLECLADYQLHRFKQQKTQDVCQAGLWQYSRHPNYFGECLIWLGFACLSCSPWAWISPLSLYCIMRFITGPMTEAQSLNAKGKLYQDYQARVAMIIPGLWTKKL